MVEVVEHEQSGRAGQSSSKVLAGQPQGAWHKGTACNNCPSRLVFSPRVSGSRIRVGVGRAQGSRASAAFDWIRG
eukprot:5045142-Pyramimonas_sp.AAC.1